MPVETVAMPYGYRTAFIDPLTIEERLAWRDDVRRYADLPGFFGQLIDLRRSTPNPQEYPGILESMQYVRSHGLQRSAVIVSNPRTALSIKQMAWRTGVYEWERYFDASSDPDWEARATAWIVDGIDPDV